MNLPLEHRRAAPDEAAAQAFLAAALARQRHNVGDYRFDGARVWVKKAGPRHARWRYALMGLVAQAFGVGLLRPVPNVGGAEAIATEARRLRGLAALGAPVPAVLAVSPQGLMLADLGAEGAAPRSLQQEMVAATGAAACLRLHAEGVEAIAHLHARGGYLSQGFARNLVRTADGAIAFLDFEEDPLEVLAQAECQARDWLCWVQSTALVLAERQALGEGVAQLAAALAEAQPAVRGALAATARRLAWLRRLPRGRRPFGRDGQRLRASGEAMHRLLEALRAS